jgi:hypothetical protein
MWNLAIVIPPKSPAIIDIERERERERVRMKALTL